MWRLLRDQVERSWWILVLAVVFVVAAPVVPPFRPLRVQPTARPDVWEVLSTLQGTGETGDDAIAATAAWTSLSETQVRAAVRYYAEFPTEVDERIRLNREESEREHASWERTRDALG